MLPNTALVISAVWLSAAIAFEFRCGVNKAECSNDTRCVPRHPDCHDLQRCAGTCERIDRYPSCGGFTVTPHNCDDASTCIDDPRFPESCGMACDAPGICVPKNTPRCGGYEGPNCPQGLHCFGLKSGCDAKKVGPDCQGICM
ncbi:hypothetical protein XA68_12345 [Ophiocordyceps unilateralis]|uniref:Uncharacterized protein n=1 Tax=Ophiocordyceps unilateralis TaxID=268505 RepID=A0A2A9PT02_OPHUN|nr:hypothetical protein XA68_12345 [Ophiocordyceps unilateralis]